MTNPIFYEGRNLGHICQTQNRNKNGELELALVFENPESTAIFVKLEGEELLESGKVLMKVSQFKETYLQRTTKIYSSQRDYERENIGGLDTNNG